MGGRRCALPPTPSSFFKHHNFLPSRLSNSLSLFVFVHHLPDPFFIPIYATISLFFLSTYTFVMFCLSISISLVCASRFLIYPNAMGGRRCALPPNPPPAFLNIIFFHASIQPPLSFCLCPPPPQPFFKPIHATISLSSFCPSIA